MRTVRDLGVGSGSFILSLDLGEIYVTRDAVVAWRGGSDAAMHAGVHLAWQDDALRTVCSSKSSILLLLMAA